MPAGVALACGSNGQRDHCLSHAASESVGGGARRAIPPAAAQRLEQRRDVGVARGLRLHQGDARELVLPLRDQQREVVHRRRAGTAAA